MPEVFNVVPVVKQMCFSFYVQLNSRCHPEEKNWSIISHTAEVNAWTTTRSPN